MAQMKGQGVDPQYRVVVRARDNTRVKDFIWEIVQSGDNGGKAVAKSIRAFKTMEEAYSSGAAALVKLNQAT
jgi:hypothetical protein